MATREEYAGLPLVDRLARLTRTPSDLDSVVHGHSAADLARRPDAKSWSVTEILCHLRDIEELCMLRFRTMLAIDDPKVMIAGAKVPDPTEWGLRGGELAIDPERWVEERQYSGATATRRWRRFGGGAAILWICSAGSSPSNGSAGVSIQRSAT